jgi:hypothetical protein
MYQSLIWHLVLCNEARGLRSTFDAERVQGAANALIDGVRGNPEFHRNLF